MPCPKSGKNGDGYKPKKKFTMVNKTFLLTHYNELRESLNGNCDKTICPNLTGSKVDADIYWYRKNP